MIPHGITPVAQGPAIPGPETAEAEMVASRSERKNTGCAAEDKISLRSFPGSVQGFTGLGSRFPVFLDQH